MPFADANQRAIHFARHGHEFGAADELQYEQMGDGFLAGPITISMREAAGIGNFTQNFEAIPIALAA